MKTKVVIGFVACCLLFCLVSLMIPRSTQAQQTIPVSFPFSVNGDGEGRFYYKLIEGHYNQSPGDFDINTRYVLYNTSSWYSITLGKVFIILPDGTPIIWDGFSGIVLNPLGYFGFNISDTGLAPQFQDLLIGILWDGDENALKITGRVEYQDALEGITHRTIYPFNLAIGS